MTVGDLIGKEINKLSILEEYRKNNRTYCKVQCSCGTIFETRKDSIMSGKTTSCGKHKGKGRIDIAGQKFGRWTALEFLYSKGTISYWLCQCECGTKRAVSLKGLRSGISQSCGCLKLEKTRNRAYKLQVYKRALEENLKNTFVEGTSLKMLTSKINKNNTTGIKGVQQLANGKYRATLVFKGECKLRLQFDTLEEATEARKAAEEKYYKPILEKYQEDK